MKQICIGSLICGYCFPCSVVKQIGWSEFLLDQKHHEQHTGKSTHQSTPPISNILAQCSVYTKNRWLSAGCAACSLQLRLQKEIVNYLKKPHKTIEWNPVRRLLKILMQAFSKIPSGVQLVKELLLPPDQRANWNCSFCFPWLIYQGDPVLIHIKYLVHHITYNGLAFTKIKFHLKQESAFL